MAVIAQKSLSFRRKPDTGLQLSPFIEDPFLKEISLTSSDQKTKLGVS